MLTDVVPSKDAARKEIFGAIFGLVIVLSAVFILELINPQLKNINLFRNAPGVIINAPSQNNTGSINTAACSNGQVRNLTSGVCVDASNTVTATTPLPDSGTEQFNPNNSNVTITPHIRRDLDQGILLRNGITESNFNDRVAGATEVGLISAIEAGHANTDAYANEVLRPQCASGNLLRGTNITGGTTVYYCLR